MEDGGEPKYPERQGLVGRDLKGDGSGGGSGEGGKKKLGVSRRMFLKMAGALVVYPLVKRLEKLGPKRESLLGADLSELGEKGEVGFEVASGLAIEFGKLAERRLEYVIEGERTVESMWQEEERWWEVLREGFVREGFDQASELDLRATFRLHLGDGYSGGIDGDSCESGHLTVWDGKAQDERGDGGGIRIQIRRVFKGSHELPWTQVHEVAHLLQRQYCVGDERPELWGLETAAELITAEVLANVIMDGVEDEEIPGELVERVLLDNLRDKAFEVARLAWAREGRPDRDLEVLVDQMPEWARAMFESRESYRRSVERGEDDGSRIYHEQPLWLILMAYRFGEEKVGGLSLPGEALRVDGIVELLARLEGEG